VSSVSDIFTATSRSGSMLDTSDTDDDSVKSMGGGSKSRLDPPSLVFRPGTMVPAEEFDLHSTIHNQIAAPIPGANNIERQSRSVPTPFLCSQIVPVPRTPSDHFTAPSLYPLTQCRTRNVHHHNSSSSSLNSFYALPNTGHVTIEYDPASLAQLDVKKATCAMRLHCSWYDFGAQIEEIREYERALMREGEHYEL